MYCIDRVRRLAHIIRVHQDFYRNCKWPETRAIILACLFETTDQHTPAPATRHTHQQPIHENFIVFVDALLQWNNFIKDEMTPDTRTHTQKLITETQ